MSQLLEKAFHLNIKRFLTKRLQGMVMGAFREVMGMQAPAEGSPPLNVVLEAPGLTRFAPAPPPGGMIRTSSGEYVRVEDAHEYADSQYEKGRRDGYIDGKGLIDEAVQAINKASQVRADKAEAELALVKSAGHCAEGDRCVCGGDLPRIREGCGNWRA